MKKGSECLLYLKKYRKKIILIHVVKSLCLVMPLGSSGDPQKNMTRPATT